MAKAAAELVNKEQGITDSKHGYWSSVTLASLIQIPIYLYFGTFAISDWSWKLLIKYFCTFAI